MNLWKLTCLLLFIIATFLYPQNFVKTNGKIFIDGNGNEIFLKGINLGNWLNPEGYMLHLKNVNSFRLIDNLIKELIGPEDAKKFWKKFRDNYITCDDIEFIKKSGFNHVRVPFNFRLFMIEDEPEIFLDEGFRRLDSVIAWCKEFNLYVILDMHAAPGGQTGDNIDDSWGYPFLFESQLAQNATIELWKSIADRYKDESIILGYDLLNEPIPHFMENKEELNRLLEPLYKKITAAIRSVDKNHIIFLGGAQWNTNFKVFGKPFDSNIAYTFHKYWMLTEQREIQQYIDFRDKYNVPVWLGESGENDNEWIKSFRELLEKNNIGWCFWPYKKMGSTRGVVSFNKTLEWDEIIKYAEGSRKNFEDIRKNKPPKEVITKALSDLLENIKFRNCVINKDYLKALGLIN